MDFLSYLVLFLQTNGQMRCVIQTPQVQVAPVVPAPVREPIMGPVQAAPQMIPIAPVSVAPVQPAPQIIYVPVPAQPMPEAQPAPVASQPAQVQAPRKSIEIITMRNYRDLSREFVAYSAENLEHIRRNEPGNWITEDNYINMGIVFNDEDNRNVDYLRSRVVTVTATDATQNRVINGTGSMSPSIYRRQGGMALSGYYYPYTYEFRTAGTHRITFSTEGLTETIEIVAR